MSPQNHIDTIKPLIGEKENAIEAEVTKDETLLLTDRRLFSVETKGRNDERTVVDSIHLNLVGETQIEHETTADYDEEKVMYGIGAAFVALLSFGVTGIVDGSLQALTLMVGIGVGLMGVVLLIEGYNPENGSVTVELHNESDSMMRRVRLGEDQLEFAEAIARAVSSNIAQPEKVSRKVGN